MSEIETQRLLGQLVAKMDMLQRSQTESEERARQSRDRVYAALETIRSDAAATRARVAAIEQTLDGDVKPVVQGVLDWKSRAIGAATIMGAIGTLMVLLLSAARDLLLDIWRLLVNR